MEKRRSKLQIYLETLKFLSTGIVKPTSLMYKLNISWRPLIATLTSMETQGLIEERREDINKIKDKRTWRTFHITEKGREVLQYFIKFRREHPSFAEITGFVI